MDKHILGGLCLSSIARHILTMRVVVIWCAAISTSVKG